MSFRAALKKEDNVISLDDSDGEPAIESKNDTGPNEETETAVKAETPDDDEANFRKRKAHHMLWGEHEGHGFCRGSNQLPCCFGVAGSPAQASPCGRCDLCSSDSLEALHEGMPQRITHLLANLSGKPL